MIKEGFQPAMQAKLPSAFFFLVVLIWVTAVTYTRGKEFLSHLGIIEGSSHLCYYFWAFLAIDLSPITYILIGFTSYKCILYKNSKRFYSLVLLKGVLSNRERSTFLSFTTLCCVIRYTKVWSKDIEHNIAWIFSSQLSK